MTSQYMMLTVLGITFTAVYNVHVLTQSRHSSICFPFHLIVFNPLSLPPVSDSKSKEQCITFRGTCIWHFRLVVFSNGELLNNRSYYVSMYFSRPEWMLQQNHNYYQGFMQDFYFGRRGGGGWGWLY